MLTKKANLTHAYVSKLPIPTKGRTFFFDAKLPGLCVCCWPTGTKTFILYRKIGGRPIRLKIGRFGDMSVEQARREAVKLAGDIAAGKNPADEKRKARDEITLTDLWGLYFVKHSQARKRTWKEDKRQWGKYCLPLKNRRLSEIGRANVRDWHSKLGADYGRYQANRALALLSSMFAFARDEGYERENPCFGIKRFKESSRDRFLSPDELAAFLQALKSEPPPWGDFFQVLLFTGARIANVREMLWADLELTRGLWRIPGEESKSGDPLIVILVPAVTAILERRFQADQRQREDKRSQWVFPGKGGKAISYPQKPWLHLLAAAGLANLRPHDLAAR